jgi:hypothetical protein
MALTRNFRDSIHERAQREPPFARAFFVKDSNS